MFSTLNVKNLAYIDIETVPLVRNFEDLDERLKTLWIKRLGKKELEPSIYKNGIGGDLNLDAVDFHWKDQAALLPEFGKIVSIVIGAYTPKGFQVVTVDWRNGNEKDLLQRFSEILDHSGIKPKKLVAHNGKGFDYPWLVKRYLINGMNPHPKLWLYDKKPWEVECLDTKEIWKFGSFGMESTSLDLLTAVFDLPSPKAVMNGADVWKYFYNEDGSVNMDGMKKISTYCENDVISLAQMVAKMTLSDQDPTFDMPQLKEFE